MLKRWIVVFLWVMAGISAKADAPPLALSLAEAPRSDEELITHVYRVKYGHGAALRDSLEYLASPFGKVVYSEPLNALILMERKSQMDHLLRVLGTLDVYLPQVLVNAKIVEMTVDSDFELEWGHALTNADPSGRQALQDSAIALKTPGSNPSSSEGLILKVQPFKSDVMKLDLMLRALVSQGRAKILSAPNVVVSRGAEASIITGEELPIQSSQIVGGAISTATQFKKVGIKLRVSPSHITEENVRSLSIPRSPPCRDSPQDRGARRPPSWPSGARRRNWPSRMARSFPSEVS